jgi:RNA polymerase sigma-70 factor (ECF subfamily)
MENPSARRNPVHIQESDWLARARQGDEAAFSQLVETHQGPVFNLCYRMLGDATMAEDAAQETFLRAYQGMAGYELGRSLANWLLAIASHYCIDQLRRRRFLTFPLDLVAAHRRADDGVSEPEVALDTRERERNVHELLRQLRPLDRAVTIMRYWYDLSYEEIAEALSLSVSAVKSRLHRARRQLARRWIEMDSQAVASGGRQDEASAL